MSSPSDTRPTDRSPAGYWPSAWPGEDGGPARRQAPHAGAGLGLGPGDELRATNRALFGSNMVVQRDPGELYVHGAAMTEGTAWVERIDPTTLDPLDSHA